MVTLTGAGGVGWTRLAVHVAADLAGEFGDGVCYVDLAPITHPDVVAVTAARALGLPDQPGRSTMDTLLRHLRDREILLVLDNCEHLLEASAGLAAGLLSGAPRLTVLATSREPLGVTGEAMWQVPSLALAEDAIECSPTAPDGRRPTSHRRRQLRRRGGDLPAPGRDAAGDRTRRRAGARAVIDRDRRQPA